MAKPPKNSPYRLMVEGTDDQHALIHLLALCGYHWEDDNITRPYIEAMNGIDKLLAALENDDWSTTVKSIHRLGIVLDADDNLLSRWNSLKERFKGQKITLPDAPDKRGTIVNVKGEDGLLERLGIWLMPDNALPGCLETFLTRLVDTQGPLWQHAYQSTQAAIHVHQAPLKEIDLNKGALHTWLAWQERPGMPFGTALQAKLFQHNCPTARSFASWFTGLFG